ncbi:hypothetical protein AABD41_01245 [Staphylococcus pseudoxylosus]|uniref:hypothetical protein n=1 Tax=Staphylococcus pseudoxylosus TaxID=2282419 RepID=UPI00398ADF30
MKKLLLPLTITGVLLLGGCDNNEKEKFLEGKWEGTNNSNEMIFKNGKHTIITDEGKDKKPYKVIDEDEKNIITIATDGKEFNDNFDGFTYYSEFKKDDDKLVYLLSYLTNDETGNYANQYTVDGNDEEFKKVTSFSFTGIGKGLLTIFFICLIAFGAIRAYKVKQGEQQK